MEIKNQKKTRFQKRDQLMDAALDAFIVDSFEQTSLNGILQAAQVSKGVFYHHFSSKEDLYIQLVGHLYDQKIAFLAEHLNPRDLKGDLFQVLRQSIQLSLVFAKKHPKASAFTNRLLKERGQAIYEKVMSRYTVENDTFVRSLVQGAIAAGNWRSDYSLEFVERLISLILNNVNEILNTEGIEDYEIKVEELLTFLEYGLRKTEHPSQH